jgi:hypothetical protein
MFFNFFLVGFSLFFLIYNINSLFINKEKSISELEDIKTYGAMYFIVKFFIISGYIFNGFVALQIPFLVNKTFVVTIILMELYNVMLNYMSFKNLIPYTYQQVINNKLVSLLNIILSLFIGGMIVYKMICNS